MMIDLVDSQYFCDVKYFSLNFPAMQSAADVRHTSCVTSNKRF